MRHSSASPVRTASSTTRPLSTGSAPGKPRQTGVVCVLGSAPKVTRAVENSLLVVSNCAWTSRPMTGWKSESGTRRHSLMRRSAKG